MTYIKHNQPHEQSGIMVVKLPLGWVGPHLKAFFILLLTLVNIQTGMYEILENRAFVDAHCTGDSLKTDKFIPGYCEFHRKWADHTSLKTIVHSFCFAGIWQFIITVVLIIAMNDWLLLNNTPPVKKIISARPDSQCRYTSGTLE
jgi:hypothetical protein